MTTDTGVVNITGMVVSIVGIYNKTRIPQSLAGKSRKAPQKKKIKIPQSAVGKFNIPFELSWTHYIQLLKIENQEEREFYEIEFSLI